VMWSVLGLCTQYFDQVGQVALFLSTLYILCHDIALGDSDIFFYITLRMVKLLVDKTSERTLKPLDRTDTLSTTTA